jgi:hypothetical protein
VPYYEPWPALKRATWRPDIRAAVLANQRVGIHRKLMKAAVAADLYPVAIGTGCIVHPSTGPSPLDVLPYTDEGKPAPGTTDDARIRDITQALPPRRADRLFTARERGAKERQLQRIAAGGLAEMYFRNNNTRAHGLGVEFTDVEHVEIGLRCARTCGPPSKSERPSWQPPEKPTVN